MSVLEGFIEVNWLDYREDYLTSQSFRTPEEKDNYFNELKTAAETGWDFSSRWFIFEGTNKGTKSTLTFGANTPQSFQVALSFLKDLSLLILQR